MFGIGLPEMIVIFAVALIVVGPDKLPGLARSLAKGMMEMKKTLNQFKENLTEESEQLDSVHKELRTTAEELKERMIDTDPSHWHPASGHGKKAVEEERIEAEIQPAQTATGAPETPSPTETADQDPPRPPRPLPSAPPADHHRGQGETTR